MLIKYGIGGCWGISGGDVLKQGEDYCKKCEYHKSKPKALKATVEGK